MARNFQNGELNLKKLKNQHKQITRGALIKIALSWSGETGIRASLRNLWRNPCRFNPCLQHSSQSDERVYMIDLKSIAETSVWVRIPSLALGESSQLVMATVLKTAER